MVLTILGLQNYLLKKYTIKPKQNWDNRGELEGEELEFAKKLLPKYPNQGRVVKRKSFYYKGKIVINQNKITNNSPKKTQLGYLNMKYLTISQITYDEIQLINKSRTLNISHLSSLDRALELLSKIEKNIDMTIMAKYLSNTFQHSIYQ